MNQPVSYVIEDGIGVITIDNPPVNALSHAVRQGIQDAIRQAQEGHAIVCFLVESTGAIVEPEFIELSDDIFRDSTLRAVLASSYRGWVGEPPARPGCRMFDFELDPIG